MMIRILCLLAVVGCVVGQLPTCAKDWRKAGCFHDSMNPRTMSEQLVNMRDPSSTAYKGYTLDWGAYRGSLNKILCDCGQLAKAKGHQYFGLQFFGECWSGAGATFNRDGGSAQCINANYKPCDDTDGIPCVGKASTNYVYKLEEKAADGVWGAWGDFSICSASCGGGERFRERACPAGKTCMGNTVEVVPCNTEVCEEVCHEQVDIGVIMDASSSVKAANYKKMKEFFRNLTASYAVNENEVHFGAIHYSTNPTVAWKINNKAYWDNKKLANKVMTIPYTKGRTRTDLALKQAEKSYFCGAGCGRSGVQKALIVMTDGRNNRYLARKVTANMRADGVTIVAVGIKGADQAELERIASTPNDVINIKDFKYLVDKINKIIKLTCKRTSKQGDEEMEV